MIQQQVRSMAGWSEYVQCTFFVLTFKLCLWNGFWELGGSMDGWMAYRSDKNVSFPLPPSNKFCLHFALRLEQRYKYLFSVVSSCDSLLLLLFSWSIMSWEERISIPWPTSIKSEARQGKAKRKAKQNSPSKQKSFSRNFFRFFGSIHHCLRLLKRRASEGKSAELALKTRLPILLNSMWTQSLISWFITLI